MASSPPCEFCGEEFSDPANWRESDHKSDSTHECPEVRGKVPVPDFSDKSRPFACKCGTQGREEIRVVRELVYETLSGDKYTVDASNVVSSVVYNLEFGYSVAITGISADMWAGIAAKTHDNKHQFWVECDDIEDGFAYLYLAAMQRLGDGYDYDVETAKKEREAGR